jgi:hypothetical protein
VQRRLAEASTTLPEGRRCFASARIWGTSSKRRPGRSTATGSTSLPASRRWPSLEGSWSPKRCAAR